MSFEAPLFLLLLVPTVLAIVWAWRRSFVGFGEGQLQAMLVVRLLIAIALIVALARPELVMRSRRLGLAVAVDVSDSVAPDRRDAALSTAKELRRRAGDRVETRIVTFAATPHLGDAPAPRSPGAAEGRATDLAGALRFAAATLPEGTSRRVVLLSDGRETTGDARRTARSLGELGVEIDPLPLPPSTSSDGAARDLVLPDGLRSGLAATATAVLSSTAHVRGHVTFAENGIPVESRDVDLPVGTTSLRLPFTPSRTGLVHYSVALAIPGDAIDANDRFERLVDVAGDPRVLLVDDSEAEANPLADALRAQGVDVELRAAGGLPRSIEEISGYDAIFLSEIAPSSIDRLAQGVLESYVRDFGGGLVVVSGPSGLHGEAGTPFARLLPVELDGSAERQVPPVALVLVMDRSGSMAGQKLEYAKAAALATVDALPPTATIGVVAFDADYSWVVPLQPASQKEAIRSQIASLAPGGGTRFFPALKDVFYSLRSTDAGTRHIVLLTDGLSTDGDDFDALVGKMHAGQVTLSSVAISREADQKLLKHLADLGGGRYHFTESAADVPRIFVDEAKTATSNALADRSFQPKVVDAAQEILGVDLRAAPMLRGYVTTRAKATSETLLAAEGKNPLLVRWRYGLGQVEVFTSDAKARWSVDWLAWPGYGRMWGQIAHATMRTRPREDLVTRLERRGERVHVTVDAGGAGRRASGLLDVKAIVVDGALVEHELPLAATGPALYEGELALPPGRGSILARPVVRDGGSALTGRPAILDEPYPQELLGDGDDEPLLRAIADESGGRMDAPLDELARLDGARRTKGKAPIWEAFATAALLFFLLDLFLKRVRLGGD